MKWIVGLIFLPLLALASQPTQIKTAISFSGEPGVAIKSIVQCFHTLGYRLDIDNVSIDSRGNTINGIATGIKPFSPDVFAENLKEAGIRVEKIGFNGGNLELTADAQKAEWNTQLLGSDEGVELQKNSMAQWFRVEEGQTIRIQAPYVSKWYPDIAVLDASLSVLHAVRSQKAQEELELELPKGARYLKISNAHGMKVMSEGMWIESMSQGR